ncbi:BON domain-containing protein [Lysobacter niabensis]|uniref:BON domain-containing protein n=1 Tax=Agrilutibacter niabensis TaxID=380628 RepID=UPI0036158E89
MNSVVRLAVAFAAGAAVMYYLDPEGGRLRRARVRERGGDLRHKLQEATQAGSRRRAERSGGTVMPERTRVRTEPVDDALLRDRIRSRLGHVVAHSSSLLVDVEAGHVVIGGAVAAGEIEPVVLAVAEIPGVRSVDNRLSVQAPAGGGSTH